MNVPGDVLKVQAVTKKGLNWFVTSKRRYSGTKFPGNLGKRAENQAHDCGHTWCICCRAEVYFHPRQVTYSYHKKASMMKEKCFLQRSFSV